MSHLQEQWAETLTVFFLALGFVFAVLLRNDFLSYSSIFLSGSLAGRIYYIKRYKEPIFPFILIIIGFLLGYIIGSVWVSRVAVFLFFVLGFGLSYYLHLKKIFVIFKSENFLK